jgi:hypothetical protein
MHVSVRCGAPTLFHDAVQNAIERMDGRRRDAAAPRRHLLEHGAALAVRRVLTGSDAARAPCDLARHLDEALLVRPLDAHTREVAAAVGRDAHEHVDVLALLDASPEAHPGVELGLLAERERDGARHEVRDGELRLGLTRMRLEKREQRARVDVHAAVDGRIARLAPHARGEPPEG